MNFRIIGWTENLGGKESVISMNLEEVPKPEDREPHRFTLIRPLTKEILHLNVYDVISIDEEVVEKAVLDGLAGTS